MGDTIALIACAKSKNSEVVQAQDLYQSTLFRYNLKYAKQREADEAYILSAKHGLLGLSEVIEPYDRTLRGMPVEEAKRWASRVANQLEAVCDFSNTHFIILAGRRYRKHLLPYLGSCEIPMEGMGIGQQLQFLKRQTS